MKNIILLFLLLIQPLISCKDFTNKKLKVIYETKIDIPEPSGLALSFDKKNLWTVSDENSLVYLMSLDGKIKKRFNVNAEDLEGISTINDATIAVISEKSREIIFLDTEGIELFRRKVFDSHKINNGPEGISYNENNNHFFIVNEKNPVLLIEYDREFQEIKRTKINFVKDLSGSDYEENTNKLWIISDESKLILKCNVDGSINKKYKVNIDQIEGIAVDEDAKKIFLVSDKEEKLYILEIK